MIQKKTFIKIGNNDAFNILSAISTRMYVGLITLPLSVESWRQFHQPTGAKQKCADTQCLAQKDVVQFHQQT